MKNKYNLMRIKLWLLFLAFGLQNIQLDAQSQQYLHFDKVDDFVEVPNASAYIANGQGLTLTGWFWCDALAYGQGMFGFRNGGTGDGEMYMIQLNDGVLENRYIVPGGFSEVVAPAFTVLPETWQHYAWVYDGSQALLYLDGQLVGSTPATAGPITSMDTPFAIGQLISPFNFFYGGRIDEVSVWSKGLSQSEIQDMIDNELNGDEPNLELYYKFNQGVPDEDNTSITKLISEVGNGERDGDLTNFALTGTSSNFGGELDNSFQAITFPSPGDKLISDAPFNLTAMASSALPISYSIVSGPASVSGSEITLDGVVGEVTVRASQPGDGTFTAAEDIDISFMVLDPNTFVPTTDPRSPLNGKEVWVPELGPIQLASITSICSPGLFEVDNVVFEIDGTSVNAKDWGNDHYTGWWTPPAYGAYTMNIISTNNYGGTDTEVVNFTVVNTMTDLSSNAATDVLLNINIGEEFVTAELPCYMGAFDQIMSTLTIDCPTGGCDPWDRISGIEVKGHNGTWYEIIRYITPYGIACDHTVDLTDFMSLLQGKVDFRFYLGTQGDGFLYTLDFDYGGGIPTHKYSNVDKLWNDDYQFGDMANLQPCPIRTATYPDNVLASKIKLLATGHGWSGSPAFDTNTGNAAEFHEDTHHIWVNGEETFEHHNWVDCDPNPDGCNDQAGTWYHDRAGWCPGNIAPWFDYDMTGFISSDDVELRYIFDEDYQDFCHQNNPNCISGVTCSDCNGGINPHLVTQSFLISLGDQPIDESSVFSNVDTPNRVDFTLYPNPSSGTINVEFDETTKVTEIRVMNSLGQLIRTFDASRNTNVVVLHLEHVTPGIYFVELRTAEGTGLKKVVIE